MGSRTLGFSSCGSQALEHRLNSCVTRVSLLHTASGVFSDHAPHSIWGLFRSCSTQHLGSFQIRDRTHVSCTGRWMIPYHWATRKALAHIFLSYLKYLLLIIIVHWVQAVWYPSSRPVWCLWNIKMIKISEDLWQRSGELESIWGKTEYAVYQVEASFF